MHKLPCSLVQDPASDIFYNQHSDHCVRDTRENMRGAIKADEGHCGFDVVARHIGFQ